MKKNKTTISLDEPVQGSDKNVLGIFQNGSQHPGQWMEFEDSFIQILSGNEPVKTWYSDIVSRQQQIAC